MVGLYSYKDQSYSLGILLLYALFCCDRIATLIPANEMPDKQYSDIRPEGCLIANLRESGEAVIETVYVYPANRGKGVGSELIGAFVNYCKQDGGIVKIKADILPEKGTNIQVVRNFYEQNGFCSIEGSDVVFLEP